MLYNPCMRALLLFFISLSLWGEAHPTEGLERAVGRYKHDVCDEAKRLAKERYEIVDMDVGCICEMTDSREWICFSKFIYSSKKIKEK